jgi:outer membrane protein OmpA-like peptidoglycan-associated protein
MWVVTGAHEGSVILIRAAILVLASFLAVLAGDTRRPLSTAAAATGDRFETAPITEKNFDEIGHAGDMIHLTQRAPIDPNNQGGTQRSLPAGQEPAKPDDTDFVKPYQRSRSTDKISQQPQIDLNLNFDSNSAELMPAAKQMLARLGSALQTKELKGSVLMLEGYADAKESSESRNRALSDRRAETVKRFLVKEFHIPAARLITTGFGSSPIDPDDPYAAENRRVKIITCDDYCNRSRSRE